MARVSVKSTMKILILLVFAQVVICQSTQKSLTERKKKREITQNVEKSPELPENKLQGNLLNFKSGGGSPKKPKNLNDLKNSSRKPKSLTLFPFFPFPSSLAVPPEYFYPQNKEVENSYTNEWLSRTEPFKKNPLIDSPTYYIRLPPNPYIFSPGLGYVSRPPILSDPELLENGKGEQANQVGTNFQQAFYKLPINFVSNGKPTSVYQLPNGQTIPKPESSLINLTKGPYVFNGKPNEIYLIAQIYDALYGDELAHFYP